MIVEIKGLSDFVFFTNDAMDLVMSGVMGVMFMKNTEKSLPLFACLSLCLAIVGNQNVIGQSEVNESPQPVVTPQVTAPYKTKVIAQLNFVKTNLKDVLSELRDIFDGVQFVTNGPVERLTVDIELRSVNLRNILTAIEIQLEGQIRIREMEGNLVAVYANVPPAPKPILRAFSIAPYIKIKVNEAFEKHDKNLEPEELETLKDDILQVAEDEIYDTIERSLQMLRDVSETSDQVGLAKLSIHPRSKLMIAVGSPESVEVVGQIVIALNGQMQVEHSYSSAGGEALAQEALQEAMIRVAKK